MSPVDKDATQISVMARRAVQARDWPTVRSCAGEILRQNQNSAEGYFLSALAEKAAGRQKQAMDWFSHVIELDSARYDAAIELAALYIESLRHREALDLQTHYESYLANSPLYLDKAASNYSRLGLHARAWPLYQKANELQPGIDLFQANLAACAVYLGHIEEAKTIYQALLVRHPTHQQNHFELSRLTLAKDASHVEQMQAILHATALPPAKNIFLYYAIGKELEDLERWEEAFHYYKLAGDTVTSLGHYDVASDLKLIDKIIDVCTADWLTEIDETLLSEKQDRTPIFIVGLPRTGTTLTERIIASHSQVESADESFFLPLAIRQVSGLVTRENMSPAIVEAAAQKDPRLVATAYLNAVDFRLSDKPVFIEKLPENFLYLGFIAKAFPHARIIHLNRNPMDTCFALYKQSFFKFAYNLESLAEYYLAHDRLHQHWKEVLGDRLIELEYELLAEDGEFQIRGLLNKLGLEFEQACLDFDQNKTATATASSVQVREKIHQRSVNKWKNFEHQLKPLSDRLEAAGVVLA